MCCKGGFIGRLAIRWRATTEYSGANKFRPHSYIVSSLLPLRSLLPLLQLLFYTPTISPTSLKRRPVCVSVRSCCRSLANRSQITECLEADSFHFFHLFRVRFVCFSGVCNSFLSKHFADQSLPVGSNANLSVCNDGSACSFFSASCFLQIFFRNLFEFSSDSL